MSTTKPKVRWGWLLVQGGALALAIGVVLSTIRVSPGDLAAVHAREPALEGSAGCRACHGESRHASLSESCASCHADVQSQIAGKRGLHGSLPSGDVAECGRCHREHQGRDFPPVHRQSFEKAGIGDVSLYAHETLEFRLSGAHLALECTRCHALAEMTTLGKGQKRYLGLDQTCTRCHQDVHHGSFGSNCQSCHGQEQPFKSVAGFRHTDAFPLTGGHAGLQCAACHEPGTVRGPSTGSIPVRACVACHKSPHGGEFLSRIGGSLGIAANDTCVRCHRPEQRGFLGPHATISRKQHASVGFPLTPPHHQLSCSACHADYGKPLPGDLADAYHRRYPGRNPDNCKACHGDAHRGEFEIGVFKGRDCLSCHTRQAFSPPDFDMLKHDAVFKLEGRHRKLRCDECHRRTEADGPRDYRGVPTDCRSCHQDPHGGQFDKPIYLGGDCRSCHTQTAWRPPTFTVEMHQKTRFALTGAHLGISCTRCHEAPSTGTGASATKPCPRKFSGVGTDCASCHADVHGGTFDGPGRPAEVRGERSCARCHGTDSFRALVAKTFDHSLWTGYALSGAHSKLDCAACHGRSAAPDVRGRTLGRAAGSSCQSCHSDPHAGQFGPTASVACATCHREEGSFRDLRFDHQKDSRFPLDELHSKLDCAKCHKSMPVNENLKAIRYKPLGTKCGDCHDPRGSK